MDISFFSLKVSSTHRTLFLPYFHSERIKKKSLPRGVDWHFPLFNCRVPNAADTGCCALEFGECQPQCRNRQHKLIQQRLMLSSDYHTHAVKTKRGNCDVQD